MRTPLKAFLVLFLAVMMMPAAVPEVEAADLGVTRVKKARIHAVRYRSPIIRDYDGTLIVLRRYHPTYLVARGFDGAPIVAHHVRTQRVIYQPNAFVHPPYISRYGGPTVLAWY